MLDLINFKLDQFVVPISIRMVFGKNFKSFIRLLVTNQVSWAFRNEEQIDEDFWCVSIALNSQVHHLVRIHLPTNGAKIWNKHGARHDQFVGPQWSDP